ncbi:hypothetical protein BGZ52_010999, partial [Haplosporangium bisporale]
MTLSDCATTCLGDSKELSNQIDKFRKLAVHFIQDKWINIRLTDCQMYPSDFGSHRASKVGKEVIIDDNCRSWTITYEMLKRLIQVKPDIKGHILILDPED